MGVVNIGWLENLWGVRLRDRGDFLLFPSSLYMLNAHFSWASSPAG
jgi:hypothetical protein